MQTNGIIGNQLASSIVTNLYFVEIYLVQNEFVLTIIEEPISINGCVKTERICTA